MKTICLLILLLASGKSFAQNNTVGVFDRAADIGKPKNAGSSKYDAATQTYYMRGSGYNIWFNRDEFQYLYKKVGGNFIVTGDFEFDGTKGDAHRKIGWMIRENTDEAAASVNAVVHGDGLTVMQWRPLRGAYMRDPEDEVFYAKKAVFRTIQLERIGQKVIMRVANWGEPLQEVTTQEMPDLKDSVLVGAFITAHDSTDIQAAKIWNVRIDKPLPPTWHPNPQIKLPLLQGVVGSRLETVNVLDGKRLIIHESAAKLETPAWMAGGDKLSFSESGSMHTIATKGGAVEKLNSMPAEGMKGKPGTESSPDGKYIYYNANTTGTMQLWRMKRDGTAKEQLTFDEYQNWFPHPSPDGKWIAFSSFPTDVEPATAPAYKKMMIRLMPAFGGAPKVIAYVYGGGSTMNNNSWSPDSKQVAFISNGEKR